MAKKWYWDDIFKQALPKYLAKWYVITHIDEIEAKCRKNGVAAMMQATDGYYSITQVGGYAATLDKSYHRLVALLKESKDPIMRSMFNTIIVQRMVKTTKGGVNVELMEALVKEVGTVIQCTQWWKESISEIRKSARRTRIVQRVMES